MKVGVCVAILAGFMLILGSGVGFAGVNCGDNITNSTVLTNDLLNCSGRGLTIVADGITLDCSGHAINGNGNYGIVLDGRSSVKITNCNITRFSIGISISSSFNITLNNITTSSNIKSLDVSNSNSKLENIFIDHDGYVDIYGPNNILTNITMLNSGYIGIHGIGNFLNNIYINNSEGISLSPSNVVNNVVSNYNNGYGIYISSTGNALTNITTNNNRQDGIQVYSTIGNVLSNVTTSFNGRDGIHMEGAIYTNLSKVTAYANSRYGIYLQYNGPTTLRNCNMSGNTFNFYIYDSEYNWGWNNNIDASNIVDYTYRLYYNYSIANYTYDMNTSPGAGMVLCAYCRNITIKDLNLSHSNVAGIYFKNTLDSKIQNITADSNDYGIYLSGSSNNSLSGIKVDSNIQNGIYLTSSSNNNLTNISASLNHERAIYLGGSYGNRLRNINASSNFGHGIYLGSSNGNVLDDVIASNNRWGALILDSSINNTLSGISANFNGGNGIRLWDSNSNNITDVVVNSNGSTGIFIDGSSNSNILNNIRVTNATNIIQYGRGVYLAGPNNILSNIILMNNDRGIDIFASNNTITNSFLKNNIHGIIIQSGYNSNTISGNIIINNYWGIMIISGSLSNLIYNNFFNNTVNAIDNAINIWNVPKTPGTNIINGSFLGGNFWSDYNGTDVNGDGLGDTNLPYNNSGQIQRGGDLAPLVSANVVNVTLPPPELRIFKWGTDAVPGRVLNYYILLENVGDVPAENVDITEALDPDLFSLVSTDPAAFFEISDDQEGGQFILWNTSLNPFESKILSYKARLNWSTPLGTPVIGGLACASSCGTGRGVPPPGTPDGPFPHQPLNSIYEICPPDPPSGQGQGGYGCTRVKKNGDITYHGGIDLSATQGTPVYSVDDGVIIKAGWENDEYHCGQGTKNEKGSGFGLRVVVRHPNGGYSVYGHLSDIDSGVIPNKNISAGQRIGHTGNTGNVCLSDCPGNTGECTNHMPCEHLHFEYHFPTNRLPPEILACYKGDKTGCPDVDPCAGLSPTPEKCSCKACKVKCTWFPDIAHRALDPNEKGVLANKFIQPNQTLVYPIHFENIGGADALDVFLTDELPPNLNLSTLEVLSLTEGLKPLHANETVMLFYQTKNKTIIIGNITINITTIENWTATLAGRTIKWNLSNIELPPNETNNVLLSIKPNLGLTSGTEIHNNATIQFETFEKMTTNNTLNIIDGVIPVCTMNPLPNITQTLGFDVSWNGTDQIGEISFFDVFVSVNNINFTLFKETTDTSAVFDGEGNKTYAFYCTATDTAGNEEIQEPAAEAATRVALISGVYGFVNNALNYSVAEANVSVTGAVNKSILTDIAGAYYISDLPFGNYSIKVSAPNFDEFRDNIAITAAIPRKDVVLRLTGDVKIDCIVNIFDLATVGLCFGKPAEGSCVNADAKQDGIINIFDLATVGLNFGKQC